MSVPSPHEDFVGKWLAAEPWHRLLLVFEPSTQRPTRTALEGIGFELRQAALNSSDPRVAAAKLGWWAEEWAHVVDGSARHPLSRLLPAVPGSQLVEHGRHWVAAASALASDDSPADLDDLLGRWHRFAAAQAALSSHWLPQPETAASRQAHAVALLAEHLPGARSELERGRLPLPLSVLARHGLTRGLLRECDGSIPAAVADHAGQLLARSAASARDGDTYRFRQLGVARVLLGRAVRRPAEVWSGERRVPALKALWAAWRAA